MSSAPLAAAAAAGGCSPLDIVCGTGQVVGGLVSSVAQDSLQQFVNDLFEAFGKATAAIGSVWVDVPSAVLTGGGAGGGALGAPPEAGDVTTLLGWVSWVSAGIAIVSLIIAGVLMAARRRYGDGEAHAHRVGVILLAVILLSSASALVAGFLPATLAGDAAGSVAGWVQDSLSWYTAGLAVLSITVAAARMAWIQRAMPLRELAGSVLTLMAVAGAGLGAIQLATRASDAFSVWILNGSTDCSVTGDQTCFGRNIAALIGLTATSPVGVIGLFILCLLAVLMAYVQVLLMVLRSAMLVLLAGVLPVASSFTNLETGRTWFKRAVAWTVAFILYKPAAAIVYASAFRLTGADAFGANGSGLFQILAGMTLMLVALVALPALMRFLVPAVAAIGGAGGGGAGLLALGAAGVGGAELATGAIRARGSSSGGGSGGGGGLPSGPSGASAAAGRAGGSAASTGAGAGAAAGPVGIGLAAAGRAASTGQGAAGAVRGATEQTSGGAAA